MGQTVKLFTELLIGEHGYLFSGNELVKREHGYLFFGAEETDTGGRASFMGEGEREGPEGVTDTSPSQVAGYDGRSPGASVMGEQKVVPSSPQKIGTHAPIASASSYLKRDTHAPFKTLAQTWLISLMVCCEHVAAYRPSRLIPSCSARAGLTTMLRS